MLKIGDTLMAKPVTFGARDEDTGVRVPMPGTVVYIHPQGNFATLEFTVGLGAKLKESFSFAVIRFGGEMDGY
jgi:hypothetical protein